MDSGYLNKNQGLAGNILRTLRKLMEKLTSKVSGKIASREELGFCTGGEEWTFSLGCYLPLHSLNCNGIYFTSKF